MSTQSEFLKYFPDFTWDFSPEFIEERSLQLQGLIKKTIDDLTSLCPDQINFKSVCESFADMDASIEKEKSIIKVYLNASPVGVVRDKFKKLIHTWTYFLVEVMMRRDIYDLLTKVQSIEKSLPYESARYLEKSLLYKKRDGFHLKENDGQKFIDLIKKLSYLCRNFIENIADEDTKLEFEIKDLLGMKKNFFKGLDVKDKKYTVTLKYEHISPILKHCKIIKTRQILEKAYNSRCIDKNVKILEEIIELRNERVKILGYKTHADFVAEMLMSKSAANVHKFLTSLFDKIKNAFKKEMERLLDLKKIDCHIMGIPFDGKINPYDLNYYKNMVVELDYQIDKNLIKEYFPFEHVTAQLLDIYQTLLGLKFEKVSNPPVIVPEVILYAVYDKATASLMGYFYMDLFSRPSKYSHAASLSLQPACNYLDEPQIGCAVLMTSFAKPLPEQPSLLTHEEVITYFHEFGHVMHRICSKTIFSLFHGTSVERDFVEAPSQMLENWCWEKESLKKLSSHYKTRKPLSDDLIEKIIKSRRASISIFYARQICFSMFDHIIHTTQKECMIKYTGIEPTPGTNYAASFRHLCCEYDALYYGYIWSQVFSYDMFSRFKKEGIFSSKLGLNFRNMILLPGSTKDGDEMLREFLGRDPDLDSFMEILGVK